MVNVKLPTQCHVLLCITFSYNLVQIKYIDRIYLLKFVAHACLNCISMHLYICQIALDQQKI